MSEKKVTPILYVCNAQGCTYSKGEVSEHAKDKPYGVVSAMPGTKAVCPVCGKPVNTIEDGRHKFLRLNSMRIGAVREKMRLIGNTMKGAQYEPTTEDLAKVRQVIYSEVDRLQGLIDAREQKILNPGETSGKRTTTKKRNTFAL